MQKNRTFISIMCPYNRTRSVKRPVRNPRTSLRRLVKQCATSSSLHVRPRFCVIPCERRPDSVHTTTGRARRRLNCGGGWPFFGRHSRTVLKSDRIRGRERGTNGRDDAMGRSGRVAAEKGSTLRKSWRSFGINVPTTMLDGIGI